MDASLLAITLRTLRVGGESTGIALVAGVPAGCALGLGRFRGRRALLAIANAGIRMPPVALGQLLWLLLWPNSQWGGSVLSGLHWIYTLAAVILAQTLLVLPILIGLTAGAVQRVPEELLDQARAFGATVPRLAALALREARIGVLAGIIAAFGTAIASVGAIVVVGYSFGTATLATAALREWSAYSFDGHAVAYGSVLLGLFLVVAAALTVVQQGRATWSPIRQS